MTSSRLGKALVPCAIAVFSACTKDEATTSVSRPDPSTVQSEKSLQVQAGKPGTVHDQLSELSADVPEFGGVYLVDPDTVVVLLTDPTRLAAARAAIVAKWSKTPRLAKATFVAREASHRFSTLRASYRTIHERVAVKGVHGTSIDARANRLLFRVADERAATELRTKSLEAGVASDLLDIRVEAPVRYLQDLNDRVRPTRGGILIRRFAGINGFNCTLGWNGYFHGNGMKAGFITNSHCTPSHFNHDNGARYSKDNLINDKIGNESVDPQPFACTQMGVASRCRYSDAAGFTYDQGVSFGLTIGNVWPGTTLDPDPTHQFTIAYADQWLGLPGGGIVYKTGRVSGTTSGVTRDCEDAYISTDDVWLLCQVRVDHYPGETGEIAGNGDSGSPVYRRDDPNLTTYQVILTGLLWGGVNCNQTTGRDCTSFVFSPLVNVLGETHYLFGW